jgi:hypothetical protein
VPTISPTPLTPGPQYLKNKDESPSPSPGIQLIDLEGNGAFLAIHNQMMIKSFTLLYGAYYLMLL